MLEKILASSAWRGATVKQAKLGTIRVYLLSHPSGATATIYKEAGDLETKAWRKWSAGRERDRLSERLHKWTGKRAS